MADLQSIIKIIFSGDDQVSQTAGNISKQLSGIGDIATGIATPFADLANKILILDAAVSAVALVIGVKAVQASNEFSAGLADLNRFLNEGEGNAQQYKQQFDDLSVKYGTNVNDIVKSTADWKAANLDVNTSLELTKIALDYSIAGQIEAGEATDTLKKIISGMSVENDKAVESSKRFGDIMNYIGDSAKTNFKQVADGVALIAPNIKLSGASFEEATAIIAVMNEVLQSGASSGAAFNVIMGQLAKPTKDAEIALKQFGVTVDQNGINQETFYGTLSKIAAKWPELTAEQQRIAAATLVSSENTKAFIPILENWGKVGVLASKSITDGVGSMSKEVERALNTSDAAFKSFNKSLDLLFITLGTQISPGIVEVVKSLTAFDVALKKVAEGKDSPFKPLSDSLSGALGEFSKVIDAVTKNLPDALQNVDFSGLIRSFDGLFGELDNLFRAFFGDIDVTTVEGLSDALQKIVDVGSTLVTTTQGIVAAFKQFAEAAGRAVDEFVKLDQASQLDFGKFIGSAKLLIDAGIGVGSALIAIGQAGADMASAIDVAFRAAKVTINTIQIAAGGIALLVTELAYKIAEVTKFAYSVLGDDAKVKEIDLALAGLQKTANDLTADIERNKKEWHDAFIPAVSDAGQKAKDANNSLLGMSLGLNDVKDSAKRATGEVADTAAELGKLADIKLDKIEVQFSSKGEAAEAAGQIKKVSDEANMLVPRLVTVRDENQKVIRTYTEMTNVIPGVTGGLSVLGSGMDKAKDKAKDAAKESDNFRIKMEEIASNERIKNIEAYVSLNVAELEAQTKQVEAAFDSINTTINSTGDLLGSLFGSLDKADTYTKLQIIEQIEAENKRRDAALELQKELTQAEIENIRAKTRALDRGDAIIKVEGTGLEPHLRAIMWEIFKEIRTTVNGTAKDYLLGLPS